jgi:hypothetical protein
LWFTPMPDTKRIADLIRERIIAGVLPKIEHDKRWVGYGQGRPCHACDDVILPAQVEHELDFADRRTVRLHSGCAGLYEAALRRDGRKPSD